MIDFIEPLEIFKRYIKNYFIVETNSSIDFMPMQRVFPSGNATMVFHYGSPSSFKKKNSSEYIEPNLLICGQQTNYYDVALSGKTEMILIVFKPHGLKAFFDFPIIELLNENLSFHDLIKYEVNELEDKLFNVLNNKERIMLLENFLLRRLSQNKDFDRVEYAIQLIEGSKGQIKTQDIAHAVCLGIKQFERIFSKHVGLNPKKFSSIIRFQNVLHMKRRFKNLSMTQLAYDIGYYDQSHFIHDFKSLTTLTPRDFFNQNK